MNKYHSPTKRGNKKKMFTILDLRSKSKEFSRLDLAESKNVKRKENNLLRFFMQILITLMLQAVPF